MAAGRSKAVTIGEDWIGECEGLQQMTFTQQMPLTSIICPKCGNGQNPKGMKLITSAGFSNVRCSQCKEVSQSSIWNCRCRIPWIKCPRHEHKVTTNAAKPNGRIQRNRTGKSFDKRGRDVPVPIKRICKSKCERKHVQHNSTSPRNLFTDFEVKSAVSKIRLEPGSRLAAKFPHLVKAAAPT